MTPSLASHCFTYFILLTLSERSGSMRKKVMLQFGKHSLNTRFQEQSAMEIFY